MGLTSSPRIVGAHVFLVRDGASFTVPSAGVASRTAKPGAADAAWGEAGICESFNIGYTSEEKEIWLPAPGARVLYDILETKPKLNFKFKLKELGVLAVETSLRTLALSPTSTQFNPLEARGVKKFWLKVQLYDQADSLIMVLDNYGSLKLPGLDLGMDEVSPEFDFTGLHSTLNTGTL